MSMHYVMFLISMDYSRFFGEHTNIFVLLFLYSIIINIFSLKEASQFHHIWGVAADSR